MVCFLRVPVHDRMLPVRWDPLAAGFERINAIGGGRNGLTFWCGSTAKDVAMRAVWITRAAGPDALEVRERPILSPAAARSAFVSARLA